MKKTLQLASAIIIPALITSNIIIVNQYKHDVNQYEHKIKNQSKLIEQYKVKNAQAIDSISNKEKEIHSLQDQLDIVKKENEQFKIALTKKNERVLHIEATAYISSCKGCSGTTYSEYPVNNTIEYSGLNIVATDTTLIPLYSIIKIATKNKSIYAIVLDKGGAIKNHKLDLLVNTYEEAIQFGKQNVTVTILREGKGEI